MEQLRVQVDRARRRLVVEQFLGRLISCVFASLVVAAGAIAVPKLFVISNLPAGWSPAWLIGSLVVGTLLAVLWTLASRRTPLDAAIEIDCRFGLRERVASSLSLTDRDQSSPAGQALIRDAARAVDRVDVSEKFQVGLQRRAWLPLLPAVVAFCLMALVNNRQAVSDSDPASTQAEQQQVKNSAEALREKIAQRRAQAEKQGFKAAEGLFKEIERGTQELTEKKGIDRTKAAVKLNNLAKQLQERRQQLGGKKELQRQFNSLKNIGDGPGDKVAQAMKQGDWQRANEAAKKLQKQLQEGNLTKNQQQQLADQLQKMQDKMESMVGAHQQAMEQLKKEIEEQQRQGDLAKAGELQQKLDQLQKQQAQMDRIQQMAQQMAKAQQAMQQGNAQQAAAAMAQMAEQLGQMAQDADEVELLDAAMDQLEMAKNAMGCEKCGGDGCAACQAGMNMGMGMQSGEGQGMGMGRGTGKGPRPDEENATNLRDTRVRQKPGRGSAVFGGMVEGPNLKGQVAESIKQEMDSLSAEPADPLTSERLPRSRREHAREYFNLINPD